MSELTTIARPYAKAAFELAVEKGAIESWNDMLFFAGHVASNEQASTILAGLPTATAQAELFINLCGEQLNEQGQNLVKVMAENGRLIALPEVAHLFSALKADYEKKKSILM